MINILYAGNDKVFDGLLISTLSIIKHTNKPIHLYVLTMDLTELNSLYRPMNDDALNTVLCEMKKINPASLLTKLDVKEIFLNKMSESKNLINRYTPYTLLRLLIDELDDLPDKLLYLDTDTMAHQDINKLYDMDITKFEFAAVKDRYGRFFFNPWYCNAGVLLLNLKRIKETQLLKKVVKYLNEKKVFLSDQTALNKMAVSKKIIARKFNEQKRTQKDTVIRHFSMQFRVFPKFHFVNIKPWQIDELHKKYQCHEFDDVLNQYLDIKKSIGEKPHEA